MSNLETSESTESKIPFETIKGAATTEDSIQETENSSQSEEKAIYLGGKKFTSVDELARYTEQLEKERSFRPQETETVSAKSKKASELIFEDPEKALEIHEQQIIQKIKAEEQAKQNEKQIWDSFYSKNKDLSDDQDLVQFAMNKHWDELKGLHPDQALEKLADYTRKTLVRFRKTSPERKELPSGPARVGPANTVSAPLIQDTKPTPVDFVTQLKKIQSKRK